MALINVGDLFMDTVYADIIFEVENIEIPGHRFVLSKTSDYFGDLLQSQTKKVEISGISAKVFQEVMRFIYKQRLEVDEWTIEDLMSLLTVAHECKLWTLFSAVIKAVEEKTLYFDSWPLVNSAASVYDSEELRSKCASFADEKIVHFMQEIDLDKFSSDLICGMFDRPKMSSFHHDQVVKPICSWKKGQSSSDISSVLQKVNWENVSPKLTAIVLRDLLFTAKNLEEHKFWTKLSASVDKPLESNALKFETPLNAASSAPLLKDEEASKCIARVDSVLLTKDDDMNFPLLCNEGSLLCRLTSSRLVFWFKKDDSLFEIPVKTIEFESSTKVNIHYIWRWDSKGYRAIMFVSKDFARMAGSNTTQSFLMHRQRIVFGLTFKILKATQK